MVYSVHIQSTTRFPGKQGYPSFYTVLLNRELTPELNPLMLQAKGKSKEKRNERSCRSVGWRQRIAGARDCQLSKRQTSTSVVPNCWVRSAGRRVGGVSVELLSIPLGLCFVYSFSRRMVSSSRCLDSTMFSHKKSLFDSWTFAWPIFPQFDKLRGIKHRGESQSVQWTSSFLFPSSFTNFGHLH